MGEPGRDPITVLYQIFDRKAEVGECLPPGGHERGEVVRLEGSGRAAVVEHHPLDEPRVEPVEVAAVPHSVEDLANDGGVAGAPHGEQANEGRSTPRGM